MKIDPLYQDICDNIKSDSYLTPKTCSLVGGLLSTPIGIVFAPVVATSAGVLLLVKGATMVAGTTIGWKLGNDYYGGNEILVSLMHQPDAWKRLHQGYQTSDENQDYQEEAVESQLLDTRHDCGKLYRFSTFLFAERYEQLLLKDNSQTDASSDKFVLRELKNLVDMMTLKHPMYTQENYHNIRAIIEQRAMDDLYTYIYGHYIIESSRNTRAFTPLLIKSQNHIWTAHKLSPRDLMVHRASLQFRHLPHLRHPREKVAILVNMVKDIDNDLKKQGVTLCCDDLIPIVSDIIMRNLDILPSAEIQLVFDYLENSCDEDAYVATVVLSSLQVCYRNLQSQKTLCLTPPCQSESRLQDTHNKHNSKSLPDITC